VDALGFAADDPFSVLPASPLFGVCQKLAHHRTGVILTSPSRAI